MGRHKGGMRMGAKRGETHDVSGEVGEARGSAASVFAARKEMELLEKQQRQTEEEGKFLHTCSGFLLHSEVRSWVKKDMEAGKKKKTLGWANKEGL